MNTRKGILLAGGSGTRLYPMTRSVSKQLLPVYDKPMIYYPLSVLMLAGIRDILIITTPADQPVFQRLLSDGTSFGLRLSYAQQPKPEGLAQAYWIGADFVGDHPSCLMLGDNLFYGGSLAKTLKQASQQSAGATIFGYRVNHPQDYGVVEFDAAGQVVSIEEKPVQPKSSYAVPGIYFYDSQAVALARSLKPSARGELEITDLNRRYLEKKQLQVLTLGRGTAWLDTGSPDALLQASNFVQAIQQRQGLKIACLEEIAFRQQWITPAQMEASIAQLGKTEYAVYLRQVLEEVAA